MSAPAPRGPFGPLPWLEGHWKAREARGSFPTISDFTYEEDIQFDFVSTGPPVYTFSSISRHPIKQTPMHQERGFLRIKPGSNELALVVSHNFGLTSVEEGAANEEKKEINLRTVSVSRMSFAKSPAVKYFERTYKLLADDCLEMSMSMETENTPLTEHLRVVYVRNTV